MKKTLFVCLAAFLLTTFMPAHGQSAVSLGSSAHFGVLSATGITNTGATMVAGNIGVHPNAAITGFFGTTANDGPGSFTGSAHQADAVAAQAQADASGAFLALNALTGSLIAQDLGGQILAPGVYQLGSALMSTALTLDGPGDYVFQIGSTLTTSDFSSVLFINGADASNLFWAVGSSATLQTGTDFAGNIIAHTSVTLVTGASVEGRIIALNGAVVMDSNTIIPEPSNLAMLAVLSIGLIAKRKRDLP